MKKEKQPLERTINIIMSEKTYEIKFPNTGQLLELAVLRAKLSEGQYNSISNAQVLGDKLAQFSIDTIAHMTILCPDLLKDLNVKSYFELDLLDMKKVVKIYIDKILPWMNSWYEVLNNIDEE